MNFSLLYYPNPLFSFPFLQQVMVKELKMLCDDSRSSSCIEHATGIIEEEKAPDTLSKRISTISLTGADKKVPL